MNTVKRWIAFPIANLSPSLSERLRLYPETATLSHGHIAPPPIARDCSRSFDTGHSRLKIFHHRMLRDRTLLSPSSLPSLLSVWSFYLPVSPPKVKTCVISHSPFFFFFIFLQSPSLIQSPPLFLLPRSRDRSADQVLEPSEIRSIYPSPLLPSLSNAEDRYVPQGFGANLPTPGREIPWKEGAAGVARHERRKVAVAATPDGLIPLPGFFFHHVTDGRKELVTAHVCAGQGWLGIDKGR